MARPSSAYPTELELHILKIIWRDGPATVRQVREALAESRSLAHTSVLTIMNIMVDKSYLRRTMKDGRYVYRARISERATMRKMVRDLVDRVFDGSAVAVVLQLLETSDIDPEELKKLHSLINRKAKGESR